MAKNWKVIHIKSKQHGETPDSPKLPTSDQLEYGEIAINYGAGIETIAIRNENDESVRFVPESKMREYVDERIRETIEDAKNGSPFNIDKGSIDSGEY